MEKESNLDIRLDKFSPLQEDKKLDSKNIKINENKIKHPLLPEIQKLLEENYSLSEIAKELNIGKGELDFIIKLGME